MDQGSQTVLMAHPAGETGVTAGAVFTNTREQFLRSPPSGITGAPPGPWVVTEF